MIGLRWLAIAIAVAAIMDPSLSVSRSERPAIDVAVSMTPSEAAAQTAQVTQVVQRDLAAAGFPVNGEREPVARVLVADRPPSGMPLDVPVWAVDMGVAGKSGVRIIDVVTSSARAPGQAAQVRVTLEGVGVDGETTDVQLEHAGVAVATAQHAWRGSSESWSTLLTYRPPSSQATVVTVRASRGAKRDAGDSRVDVELPAERPPFHVLAYDASVSWPATFVRRSLEGEAPFALSLLQRGSPNTATRAGAPPRTLSASDLDAYDLVVVGGPEELTAREVDVLQTFVRDRGGAVAVVASRRPSGGYARLLGDVTFDERMTEDPVELTSVDGFPMRASELLVARPPSTARVLLTTGPHADPVAFSLRSGDGVIVFSGALDAWRYRATGQNGFARFWQSTLADAAASVTPRLGVRVDPGLVAVGQPARIRATVRATELSTTALDAATASVSARVIGPDQGVDEVVRLWPSSEPGVFEGEWKPRAAGRYLLTVSSGASRREVGLEASEHVAQSNAGDSDGLALLAAATGGEIRPRDRASDLASSLAARFPAKPVRMRVHPMRSPWWCVPFTLALCVEWGWRRLHGAR